MSVHVLDARKLAKAKPRALRRLATYLGVRTKACGCAVCMGRLVAMLAVRLGNKRSNE